MHVKINHFLNYWVLISRKVLLIMKTITNILILLSIISALSFNAVIEEKPKEVILQGVPAKGPVFNPLRQKPYTKYTAKS